MAIHHLRRFSHLRRFGLLAIVYSRGSQTVVRAPLVVRESLLGGACHENAMGVLVLF